MLFGDQCFQLQLLALLNLGKPILQLFIVFILLILTFLVNFQEAVEFGDTSGCPEQILSSIFALGIHVDGCLIENSGSHLTGDKTHPDQTVKLHLIISQILFQ